MIKEIKYLINMSFHKKNPLMYYSIKYFIKNLYHFINNTIKKSQFYFKS